MYFEFDGRPQPEVFKTETLIELNKKATRLSCFPQTANSFKLIYTQPYYDWLML